MEGRADGRIRLLGAVRGEREVTISGDAASRNAVPQIQPLAAGAEFLVGHNIVAHDRPLLEAHLPNMSRLLNLPMIDTLYLAPLAKPQRPYHRLVKDYKLVGAEQSDPVADCRLTRELLEDCRRELKQWEQKHPWLLTFYRSCFDDTGTPGGGSELQLTGTGQFLEALGGKKFSRERLVDGFLHFVGDKGCPAAIRQRVPPLLERPEKRPAVAYSLAWLLVAGTESILPRWVHKRFPEAAQLIQAIRSTPCRDTGCAYCSEHHDPQSKLKRYFGFPGFRSEPKTVDGRSLQQRIVERAMAGQSILGIMPTGGGKSLCYQLPAILRNEQTGALTVVISPLQALMKDQVDNLNRKTISPALAVALNGLQTMPERRDVLEGIRLGRHALLYVSPEQLRNTSFRNAVRHREIATWVFDEAHCISKWGHDFRPDYLYAARFIQEFSRDEAVQVAPVACFTATARLNVREEIVGHFRDVLDQRVETISGDRLDRDNLQYSVEEIPTARKVLRIDELLKESIGSAAGGSAIIYVSTRSGTEELAEQLRRRGWKAEHFHAGLEAPLKKRVQDKFISGDLRVVVATNAFGMGIDKNDVRLVIHADVPGSIENYLQEAGRAGRGGKPARCVLLFTNEDLERQFYLASRDRLTKRDISQILTAIRRVRHKGIDEIVIAPRELLRVPDTDTSFDAEDRSAATRVKTAVSWLERARFVLRNENRTRVFQGVPALPDRATAEEKMNGLDLSAGMRRRWSEVFELLKNADLRDGIDLDRIASQPSFKSLFRYLGKRFVNDAARLNRAATRAVFSTLFDMSRAGLLESGTYFSAWIRHKIADNSLQRLEFVHNVQATVLWWIREHHGETESNHELLVSLPRLKERLRAQGCPDVTRDTLLKLLGGWARPGPAGRAPVVLSSRGRSIIRLDLQVGWDEFQDSLDQRSEAGRVILAALGRKADERKLRGEWLILFSLEDLAKALDEPIGLLSQPENNFDTIEKALLFLDEHQAIRLQQGMSIFRQAMTLQMRDEAKGKRYTNDDYRPLEEHYRERVFQIHAVGRYVKETQESFDGAARSYVDDYFRMSSEQFKQRYFRGDRKALGRATSRESYSEIVESLGNAEQEAIVTAPKERNLLVLAGPGSGKTRVVVHRCAYLLRVERIRPRNILVVCFNRSAMYELRRRLRDLVGDLAGRVAIHTYHSLALRITERSVAAARLEAADNQPINFDKIIDDASRRIKGENLPPGMAADELRDRLLAGFEYVLIDEYQDIDRRQYEMITHIARRAGSDADEDRFAAILAVGDDDQSIYEWRGASVEFLRRFEEEFAAERRYLVHNYRSTRHIIDVSNRLIAHNQERMKLDHPIRIDPRRSGDPPGGQWRSLDSEVRGRVLRLDVDDAMAEATRVLAEIERLRTRAPAPDWRHFAVLGRTHRQLAETRAMLEMNDVPIRRAIPDGLPWLGRIREFRLLLEHLEGCREGDISIPEIGKRLERICGGASPWTRMAGRMIEELEEGSGGQQYPAAELLEAIHQGLADHVRSHIVGDGVLLGTAHSAKGLEFPHVMVLGGEWRGKKGEKGQRQSMEAQRRLYYVAMTRARETLTLLNRRDDPLPYLRELDGSGLIRQRVEIARRNEETPTAYMILGMKDLYLDFAGLKQNNHPIHRALARLRAGDTLKPVTLRDGKVTLRDGAGVDVARLSRAGNRKWRDNRFGEADVVRVLAMIFRRKDDCKQDRYRKLIVAADWEVPVIEVARRVSSLGGSDTVSERGPSKRARSVKGKR